MSTAFEKSKSLHNSLGRPSRSDFVQFQFDRATASNFPTTFAPISLTHVQGFPGGSGLHLRSDMAAVFILANCLKNREVHSLWHQTGFKKCVALFKKRI